MTIIQVIIGAVSAGILISLIAWAASCARCTELRELPDKPIPMEHEHEGENDG